MLCSEYDAVRFILEAPGIAPRTRPFITGDDFDFAGLTREAETMSGGEALLVAAAYELWHADKRVGLWEIVRRTDLANFQRLLTALAIARGQGAITRGQVATAGLEGQLAA
jgi:hypothetical protein